jgi:hypothetical protein
LIGNWKALSASVAAFGLLGAVGLFAPTPGEVTKPCGRATYDPVLRIVGFEFQKDSVGQVDLLAKVTMNPEQFVIRHQAKHPTAVTQFSGSILFAWSDDDRHGIGFSVSNQAISVDTPTVIRVQVERPTYAERLFTTPRDDLKAWTCESTYSYDDGSRIIVN